VLREEGGDRQERAGDEDRRTGSAAPAPRAGGVADQAPPDVPVQARHDGQDGHGDEREDDDHPDRPPL
jgi:hypothetical protein